MTSGHDGCMGAQPGRASGSTFVVSAGEEPVLDIGLPASPSPTTIWFGREDSATATIWPWAGGVLAPRSDGSAGAGSAGTALSPVEPALPCSGSAPHMARTVCPITAYGGWSTRLAARETRPPAATCPAAQAQERIRMAF